GRAAAAGLGAGVAATSAGSPLIGTTLILRGSSLESVPLAAGAGAGRAAGATLAAVGGLAFWFSGGNTVRGFALTSTGVSSRGTIFSAPPVAMRSGTLATLSPGDAGTTLVGVVSALMTGGSPLRADPI